MLGISYTGSFLFSILPILSGENIYNENETHYHHFKKNKHDYQAIILSGGHFFIFRYLRNGANKLSCPYLSGLLSCNMQGVHPACCSVLETRLYPDYMLRLLLLKENSTAAFAVFSPISSTGYARKLMGPETGPGVTTRSRPLLNSKRLAGWCPK